LEEYTTVPIADAAFRALLKAEMSDYMNEADELVVELAQTYALAWMYRHAALPTSPALSISPSSISSRRRATNWIACPPYLPGCITCRFTTTR